MEIGEVFGLEGKVALVTGASRGIGRAVSITLASAGAKVILVSRDEQLLASLKGEIEGQGGEAHYRVASVADQGSMAELFAWVRDEFGQLDALVNNAGISPHYKLFHKTDLKDWDRILDVNLKGVFHCCYQAFPLLEAAEESAVVNVSSIGGLIGLPRVAVYTATKGAITTFTKTLAAEWVDFGIRVNAVCPGFVGTDMTSGIAQNQGLRDGVLSRIPMKRFGRPEEVANAVLFLASAASSYVTGHCLIVDGGWTAW